MKALKVGDHLKKVTFRYLGSNVKRSGCIYREGKEYFILSNEKSMDGLEPDKLSKALKQKYLYSWAVEEGTVKQMTSNDVRDLVVLDDGEEDIVTVEKLSDYFPATVTGKAAVLAEEILRKYDLTTDEVEEFVNDIKSASEQADDEVNTLECNLGRLNFSVAINHSGGCCGVHCLNALSVEGKTTVKDVFTLIEIFYPKSKILQYNATTNQKAINTALEELGWSKAITGKNTTGSTINVWLKYNK